MNRTEAAMLLAGVTSTEKDQASAPTNLHLISGEVSGDSEEGLATVAIDGLVFSEADDQYVEMDTLGGLEDGDIVTILLSGEQGGAMTPLAIGSPGSIDRISLRVSEIEADYIKTEQLEAATARIGDLEADHVAVEDLNAATARIGTLETDNTDVKGRLTAAEGNIDTLEATKATIADLNAATARIGDLEADHVAVEDLNAATARIGNLETDHVSVSDFAAEQANIDNLQAATADIATIRANSAKVANLTAAELEADHATIGTLDTNYARANLANVDNAWIENGTVKEGAITNAMINSVSANKLTAGTIDASNITVTNLNADNITAGTINGERIGNGSLSLSKLEEDVYTETEVDGIVQNLQTQIDGAIETWTGTDIPTLQNTPAVNWNTNSIKDTHVGDVYFVVNSNSQQNGYNYRFTKTGTGNSATYSWQLIKDNDVTNALQRLTDAEGKITTFDSDISTLKTTTGTLTTKTTSLETRMSDAEADILDKVDTTTFNEVSDTVDSHSQSITQMTTTLSNKADSSTVTAVTNRVSKNEQDISGINTTIGELQDTIETKADGSTVETVSNRLNTVSNTVDGHTQSLQSITQTQTTIQKNAVKSTVQLWFTKANTTAPDKPTAHVTTNNTATGNAWNLAVPTYNSAYPNYYYCYEYQYVDGAYGWSAVTRDIATGEMQERARTAITNAANAQADIDGLEIGGRNLLRNSSVEHSQSSSTATWFEWQITNAPLETSQDYTFSFDAKTSNGTDVFYVGFGNGSSSTQENMATGIKPTTAYGRMSVTARTTKTNIRSILVSSAKQYGRGNESNSGGTLYIKNVKLEKGNKATDWTPAPEDVDADISTAQTSANNAQATANKNIKESQQLWFTKVNDSAPNKPTSKVTSTSTGANVWTTKVPTYNASSPYYFYCMQYIAADGTVTWSDVVYDQATTEAQSVSRTTSANLTTLQQDYATFKQTTQNFESTIGTTYATKTALNAANEAILHGTLPFDEASSVAGYLDTAGNITAQSYKERTTDFIEVKPDTEYYVQVITEDPDTNAPWICVTFYTSDKAYSSQPVRTGPNNSSRTYGFTSPNNAAYVRISSRWVEQGYSFSKVRFGEYFSKEITQLESRVSTNETSISNNSTAIALKANSSDVYTKTAVDGKITQEVNDRNSAIEQSASAINLSVSQTYTTKTEFNNLEIGGRGTWYADWPRPVTAIELGYLSEKKYVEEAGFIQDFSKKFCMRVDFIRSSSYQTQRYCLASSYGMVNTDTGRSYPELGIELVANTGRLRIFTTSDDGKASDQQVGTAPELDIWSTALVWWDPETEEITWLLISGNRSETGHYTPSGTYSNKSGLVRLGADARVNNTWNVKYYQRDIPPIWYEEPPENPKNLCRWSLIETSEGTPKNVSPVECSSGNASIEAAKAAIKITTDRISTEVSKINSVKYVTANASSWTLAALRSYAADGHQENWNVNSTEGLRIGDTVYVKGRDGTRNCPIYIKTTVKTINSATNFTGISHGYEDALPVDTSISSINQSAESIKIQASRVEIDGTAIFTAISSDVDDAITDKGYATTTQAQGYANTAKSEAISAAATDATNKANVAESRIISRGEQLVINGNGFMGNNTNFTNLTFDGSMSNNSPGSFTRAVGYNTITTNEMFPVDASKEYIAEFDVMAGSLGAKMYAMLTFYDVDKLDINVQMVSYFPGSTTTLARELKNGDTVVYLTDASGWTDTSTAHQRSLIIWDYTNSFGYTYPAETYSRNYYANSSGMWNQGSLNKSSNTITLRTAWTGGTHAAGTPISQNSSGSTYSYFWYITNQTIFPTEWTHVSGTYKGMTTCNPTPNSGTFWPGTAYCRIGWLWNYQHSSSAPQSQIWVTNVSVKEYVASSNYAVKRTQRIYWRTAAAKNSWTMPPTWLQTAVSATDVFNQWTRKVPRLTANADGTGTKYLYLYTCEQREMVDGTLAYTPVLLDDSTTIIDGGSIITNSITANQIAAGSITANEIDASDLHVSAANIDGTLIASQINANGLTIGYSQVTGTPTIPSKVSDLTNDSGFQTASQVTTTITSKGYQTSSQVESAITSKGYATTAQAQGYADAKDSAIAAAAKRTYVSIAVTAINYAAGTATLQATLFVDGTATTSGVTYIWLKDGTAISGQAARTLSVTAAMGLEHVYSCTVTYA